MTTCPSCGSPLPADAPGGLCPACLARAARGESRTVDPAVIEALRATLAVHAPELELGELIGRGGMGFVFRGRQKRLGREVAVKVLDPELSANPLFADRFAREAQTLARLAHPHIVSVHDYGRAGELFYLVLEYVDGVNLREVLRAGKLAPEQALAIVPQLCEALQFAHERGVVHRDVKPENVLLDRAGQVKITDFGLAKLLGVETPLANLTATGQVLGTLRYMAPEQMDRPLEVDHRADIYSLGVVFYEMLTGEIPMGRFAPPSKKVRIDVQLDEVVLRTLEREPELRYQHASEVKSDVEAIEAGKTVRHDRQEEPRKVSRLAIASVGVGFGGQLVVACGIVPILLFAEPASDGGLADDWMGPTLVLIASSLAMMVVAGVLGRAAIQRIREQWPRLFGVGAAVTGLWFLPLCVFNGLVLAGIYLACAGLSVDPPPELMTFGAFFGLVCDVVWIARRRAVLLLELDARRASEVETDVEAGKKPRHDRRRDEFRRVSWLAVASVVVGFGGPTFGAYVLLPVLLALGEPTLSRTLLLFAAFWNLAAMGVACALGWMAIERIREAWPRVFGLGAALTGLFFLPLFAVNVIVIGGIVLGFRLIAVDLPVWSITGVGLLALTCDVWWIARRRTALVRELDARVAM